MIASALLWLISLTTWLAGWLIYVLLLALAAGAAATALYNRFLKPRIDYAGKHVFITGGSQGLGLELARRFVQRGAHVTIAARRMGVIDAAVAELRTLTTDRNQKVRGIAVDVADKQSFSAAVGDIVTGGVIDVAIACAGYARPGYFMEQDDAIESHMNVNYIGAVNLARAVCGGMIEQRSGQIVFVGSMCSVLGLPGYTAYAPSKFALRGFADSLRLEMMPHDIGVSIVYPADMQTPGFDEENKTKPPETVDISEGAQLSGPGDVSDVVVAALERGEYHIAPGLETWLTLSGPGDVSDVVVAALERGEYHIAPGLETWLTVTQMTGMAPRGNVCLEALLALPVSLALWWVGYHDFTAIIERHADERRRRGV